MKITAVKPYTVHASAVMPNFIITEYFLPFVEFGDRISPNQLKPKDGYIELPAAPGLGIDVDEEALKKFPGKAYPARNLRHPKDEGPQASPELVDTLG